MSSPAIKVRDLRFSVGSSVILDKVSFSVDAGDYVSIIGPNGAGKTSLIKCLNRINRIASGEITIFGKPLGKYPQRELAKHVSYVPQAAGNDFPFSVREFVLMGRYPHLSPFSSVGPRDKQKVQEVLRLTAIEDFADRPIRTLSGGEAQKVLIAAALAQGASVLLLDEPTTFLDYRHQVDVMGLLRRLNKDEGVTIVSVTHDVNAAVFAGDQVIALKNGAVAFDGSPDALLNENVLDSVYDTSFRIAHLEGQDAPIVTARETHP